MAKTYMIDSKFSSGEALKRITDCIDAGKLYGRIDDNYITVSTSPISTVMRPRNNVTAYFYGAVNESADGKSAEIKGTMEIGLNPVLYLAVPVTLYGFVASAVMLAPVFRGEWPIPEVFLTLAAGGFGALIWWGAIRASRSASGPPVIARLRSLLNE